MKTSELFGILWERYPADLAEPEDRPRLGLQRGEFYETDLRQVAVSLDIDPAKIEFCRNNGINVVVVHHPVPVFMPQTPALPMVFCLHTNFDLAEGGMRDAVAQRLDMEVVHRFKIWNGEYGVYGQLAPQSVADFVAAIRRRFNSDLVELVGEPSRTVASVAMVAGDAFMTVEAAEVMVKTGADVLLSADLNYLTHEYLRCAGVCAVNIPHHIIERPGLEHLAAVLEDLQMRSVLL